MAEALLRAEGFEEVSYVDLTVNSSSRAMSNGDVDLWLDSAPSLVNFLDGSDAVVALGGVHAGCYELRASEDIRTIRDLAGDGDHYAATVIAESFRGKSRVQQHKLVYDALKGQMGGALHALALQTGLPER